MRKIAEKEKAPWGSEKHLKEGREPCVEKGRAKIWGMGKKQPGLMGIWRE